MLVVLGTSRSVSVGPTLRREWDEEEEDGIVIRWSSAIRRKRVEEQVRRHPTRIPVQLLSANNEAIQYQSK